MANQTIEALIRLGQDLSETENASFNLWTWLPSYKVAERHHGDYASEHQPSAADVMKEAAMYLAHLSRHSDFKARQLEDSQIDDEDKDWFLRCPCGEPHEEADHG